MRIFVSWSGIFSKSVAELLRKWIPNVIQEAIVYVSSQDIAKGEAWPENIRSNLSEIDLGVVVVTRSNLEAPWIMFEAGALAKSVKSKMIPLLCGVDQVDLARSPLRLFQGSKADNAEDMLAMLQSLNSDAASPLPAERLEVAFQKWWPDFEADYGQLNQDPPAKEGKKIDDQVILGALSALLEDVQSIKSQLRSQTLVLGNTLHHSNVREWVGGTVVGTTNLAGGSGKTVNLADAILRAEDLPKKPKAAEGDN